MIKNTASQRVGAQMITAADGSAFTGAVTVSVTVDAGTQATGSVGSGACTHEGNGYHTYAPAQAETNGDLVAFTFTGTGAIPTTVQVYTVAGDAFTRLGAPAGASVSADVAAIKAETATILSDTNDIQTRIPAALVGGRIDANVGAISSDATAADNAEAFFDGTGYAGTGNVIPTVTTLTNDPGGVTTLLSRLSSARAGYLDNLSAGAVALASTFSGITSLAQWLGLLAGKQTGNSTARTEIRATGAGSGTFDETTDSQEALRDNMGTAQTGDAYARLGAPAGASVSADVAAVKAQTAAIETDTQDLQSRTPAALVGGRMAADVGSISGDSVAADNLEAAADGTGYNLGGGSVVAASVTGNVGGNVTGSIGSLATQAKADVNAEVDTALVDIHLDHLLAADYDPASKPGTATALLNELVESDAGVSRFTANALEQAPTGGSAPTAAQIADAVWEEAIADHSGTAGSTAEALNAAGSAGDPWVTALPGAYSAGQAGYLLGTNLNATVSSRATQTSVDDVPTNSELATALASADDAVLAAVSALNNLSESNIRTAIGLATANLDTQLADLPTNAELSAALAAADDAVLAAVAALNNLSSAQVQTAAAAALAAYDPPTNTEMEARTLAAASYATAAGVAAVEADTQDLQARVPAALVNGRMDATVDATGMEAGAIDAILDDAVGDGTLTVRQVLRVLVAGMAGKLSGGATTTVTIRNVADSADVIVATVDANGNRSAVVVAP